MMKFDERKLGHVFLAIAAALLLFNGKNGIAQTSKSETTPTLPVISQEIAAKYPTGIEFSPDSRYFAETTRKMVRVWSVETKQLVKQFAAKNYAHSPTFTPDSSTIVIADGVGNLEYRSTLRAWNLSTGKESKLGHCMGVVHDLQFSNDGSRLAAVSSFNSIGSFVRAQESKVNSVGEILIWRLSAKSDPLSIPCLVDKLPTPDNESYRASIEKVVPMHLAFSTDGARLATVTQTGVMQVFDTNSGEKEIETLADGRVRFREDGQIESAATIYDAGGIVVKQRSAMPWSAVSGNFALSREASDASEQIHVDDLSLSKRIMSLPASSKIAKIAVSSNGRYVAVGEAKKIVLWRLSS